MGVQGARVFIFFRAIYASAYVKGTDKEKYFPKKIGLTFYDHAKPHKREVIIFVTLQSPKLN